MWGAQATPSSVPTVESYVESLTNDLAPIEYQLWVLAVLAAVLDVSLTATGLQAGFTEGNPIVAALLDRVGIAALAGMKLAAFGIAALVRWRRPVWGPWLSLGLCIPWMLAVGVNASLLLVY